MVLGYLRFRWWLYKVKREYRSRQRKNDAELARAKAAGRSGDDLNAIQSRAADYFFYFQDDVRKVHCEYLLQEAQRLLVPSPDVSDATIWDTAGNRTWLTEKGINHMRAAVRAEKKARAELFVMWMPGIVGILGALIGLASILMSKK